MNWWDNINWFYVFAGILVSRFTGMIAREILPERGWRTLLLDFSIFAGIWALLWTLLYFFVL